MSERFPKKENKKKTNKGAVAGLAALGALAFGVGNASAVQSSGSRTDFEAHTPVQIEVSPFVKMLAYAETAARKYNREKDRAESPDYIVHELSEMQNRSVQAAQKDFKKFLNAYHTAVRGAGGDPDLIAEVMAKDAYGDVSIAVQNFVNIMKEIHDRYEEDVRVRALYELIKEHNSANVGN
ncbi:hypothetical protein JXR01_00300 [Candidatus Kaiserbacteria bacterium]|nr:MAG: hypothetical protein JXR01_00300 [Candidatus Kaiserbacteria bacterium]